MKDRSKFFTEVMFHIHRSKLIWTCKANIKVSMYYFSSILEKFKENIKIIKITSVKSSLLHVTKCPSESPTPELLVWGTEAVSQNGEI